MRWRLHCAALAAFVILMAGAALAAEPPKVVVLPNGLTVMVMEDERFPLVSVRLFVHAGSGYEAPSQAGLSHLLEHMVFKSTAKRPAGQVASDIESAGGELNASTSFDSTVYRVDLPSDRWQLGLDVIGDMIFGAKFAPEELDSERQVVLSELARGRDNPDNRLFQMTQAMAWPGKAYGWPVIGFKETVSGFTAEDLRQYVREHYQPQSMLLVVTGKVKVDDVVRQATALFGDLANDRILVPPAPYAPAHGLAKPEITVEYGPWNKVRLQIAFHTAGVRGADEAGLEVLAQLLAGDETSRLYRTFKYDKKLVDDVSCSSLTLERSGLFLVSATLDAKNLAAFWQGLLAELARLKGTSFTDREIERVRLGIEDGLYQAKETLPGLAMKAGFFRFHGYDPDGEANYLRSVRLVDQKSLGAIIEATLRPERMLTAVLAPKEAEAAVTEASLAAMAAKAWPGPKEAAAQAAAKDAGAAAAPEVVDLGGGHKLVLLPDTTLPYVAVSLAYNGGDALLAKDKQGLAELAAQSLTTGTAKLSANALEDYLADRAASLSASSGRDSFSLAAKFPSRFQKDLYGLIGDVLVTPAFLKTEVEREVADQLAAIKDKEDQPMALAFRKLFPFLFTDTAYAYTRLGEPATVKAFTAKDVSGFWADQRAMPWVLAVCGDFDATAVRALADKLAKAAGPAKPFAFPTPQWGAKREDAVSLAGRNQSHLFLVFPVPGLTSPDTPGLELLNEVLAGQSGLLFSRLRDGESLGYSVTSFLWQADTAGFMAFYIGTSPDKDAAALEGFKRIAGDLRQTALPDELMLRAKNAMTGDYYRERQALAARSDEAAKALSHGLPLDHDRQVVEAAQTLSPEALRDLAAKYLRPEAAYVFKVEP
ncbi:MAG: M16 family metallopeptidase [Solidesulfovibrio sp. DCME]|uniref:M16 family metallopeptidase n=1 Tax=Solidesulfovibrio sp. DCME TaxID=3447380 RepID=UPI003D0E5730